jgi:hypothetical protein
MLNSKSFVQRRLCLAQIPVVLPPHQFPRRNPIKFEDNQAKSMQANALFDVAEFTFLLLQKLIVNCISH